MEKLKKIIQQLDDKKFIFIKNVFVKNHSNKFLLLLQYYHDDKSDDLLELLNCNENALYVLKSRLYDKIQKHLLEFVNTENPDSQTAHIYSLDDYLVSYPRDTSIAMLHEIEKQYLKNSDSLNLINVYSVLKKAYYHSDKYYFYSQLYNKHVAYAISLEKANDTLLNFNKTLSNFYFSDSSANLEILVLLKDEVKNIYSLNRDHNIELILNIILIQLFLFTNVELPDEAPVEDLITKSEKIIHDFQEDKHVNKFGLILNFLKFEYYHSINQPKKSLVYFEKVNENYEKWLLNNNYCLAFKFLFSKLEYHTEKIDSEKLIDTYYDTYDFYTTVALKFYIAVEKYHLGQIKEAINLLNKILDDSSFVNFVFMEIEIKLTLAFIYYKKNEFELAGNLLKNLSRKLSGAEYSKYNNAKSFIKLLNLLLDEKENKAYFTKLNTLLEQFNYHNFSGRKILQHIQQEIKGVIPEK
jgi:hypothetical protein